VMFAVLCVAMMVPVVPQDTSAELKKLAGTWKADKGEMNGAELPQEMVKAVKLTMKDNKYYLDLGGSKDEGTIAVDPTRKPKTIVIKGTLGPNQGKTFLGIYEVTDDLLRICYDLEGKEYPREFSAPAGSRRFYVVYKPVKE
jgi:uncharacterized protein (TIGR03067 family)